MAWCKHCSAPKRLWCLIYYLCTVVEHNTLFKVHTVFSFCIFYFDRIQQNFTFQFVLFSSLNQRILVFRWQWLVLQLLVPSIFPLFKKEVFFTLYWALVAVLFFLQKKSFFFWKNVSVKYCTLFDQHSSDSCLVSAIRKIIQPKAWNTTTENGSSNHSGKWVDRNWKWTKRS